MRGLQGLPVGLMIVLVVFLLAGSPLRGVISNLSLTTTPESNLYLKHLLTIFLALMVMLFVLFARDYKRLMYQVWLLLAGLMTIGLFLVGTQNPDWLAPGISTVTAGLSGFKLLLFAVLAFNPGFERHSPITAAILLFVVPETLAGLSSHWLIPFLMSLSGATPNEYAGILSIATGAVLVACTIIVLSVIGFWGTGKDAENAIPSPAGPGSYQPNIPSGDVLSAQLVRLGHECRLTAREIAIAQYIARGYSTQRTAEAESVSINTVQSHMRNIYRKLDVHSRQGLIDKVERAGL